MVVEKPKRRAQSNKRRTYAYQYETSPKKLEPKSKTPVKKAKPQKTSVKKANVKASTKYNYKPIFYIIIGFAMLFTISYRNSLINETYNKKESLRTQLSDLQKENEQLKVNIESSLNLNSIEKIASEKLGMQKLTNEQKVFVSLEKKDYVEPATEEVVINSKTSLIDKILNALTQIIK